VICVRLTGPTMERVVVVFERFLLITFDNTGGSAITKNARKSCLLH